MWSYHNSRICILEMGGHCSYAFYANHCKPFILLIKWRPTSATHMCTPAKEQWIYLGPTYALQIRTINKLAVLERTHRTYSLCKVMCGASNMKLNLKMCTISPYLRNLTLGMNYLVKTFLHFLRFSWIHVGFLGISNGNPSWVMTLLHIWWLRPYNPGTHFVVKSPNTLFDKWNLLPTTIVYS